MDPSKSVKCLGRITAACEVELKAGKGSHSTSKLTKPQNTGQKQLHDGGFSWASHPWTNFGEHDGNDFIHVQGMQGTSQLFFFLRPCQEIEFRGHGFPTLDMATENV